MASALVSETSECSIADSSDDGVVDEIELGLFLEAIFRRYGFDFRHYAPASLKRRLTEFRKRERLATIADCQAKILRDRAFMERLLLALFVHVSTFFRDPSFYKGVKQYVVPILRTYPFIRVWHAGCASGEEVYSMAILLEEESLSERARIYATDVSEAALEQARSGVYSLKNIKEFGKNYAEAGGKGKFSDYYAARHDRIILASRLRNNVIWAQHNLVSDGSFNEFHLILCRNVMIYFDQTLQARVHRLFFESLITFGVLGLGHKETIRASSHESDYRTLSVAAKLYQKIR